MQNDEPGTLDDMTLGFCLFMLLVVIPLASIAGGFHAITHRHTR